MPDPYQSIRFPVAGISLERAFWDQQPRALPKGEWADTGQYAIVPGVGVAPQPSGVYGRTTAQVLNMRAYEASSQRRRGGVRPRFVRTVPDPLVAGWIVQHLTQVVGQGYSPPGGGMQLSISGRVVTLVAVSQGTVNTFNAGDTFWTTPTNLTDFTPALEFTGIMQSAVLNSLVFFADGNHWCYYEPSTNTVKTFIASAGSLPVDSDDNKPRLVVSYRGSLVWAGILKLPQSWYMSATNAPGDYDYAPALPSANQAVFSENAPAGEVADSIRSMAAWNDDSLVFFGDNTIKILQGHPNEGGRILNVTEKIGGVFGSCWTRGPDGTMYFLSNRLGLYAWPAGGFPQRISQPIEKLIRDLDTGNIVYQLFWDDAEQGVHVFMTPIAAPTTCHHLFWESRTGAWQPQSFANNNHNPVSGVVFDGNRPEDRVLVLGGWDGYVRNFNRDALDDDGTPVQSEVWLGPFLNLRLDEILPELSDDSGLVNYAIHMGRTAEEALASTPSLTGTLAPGRSTAQPIRRSAHAVYVRLYSEEIWALEQLKIRGVSIGPIQTRGRG